MKLATTFSGKNIAVLGFGVEGSASVDYLLRHGGKVSVFDDQPSTAFPSHLTKDLLQRGANFEHRAVPNLGSFDLVLRTPGVRPSHPALIGANVTTATNIFLEHCPATVIGVTGTKGKGTTATLIHDMVRAAGQQCFLGGNIGRPMLSFLDDLTPDDVAVIELSSFQLIDATRSPHIAVVLMVTSEHLDYHTDLAEYVAAKTGITRHQSAQDVVVVNADYERSAQIAAQSTGRTVVISTRTTISSDGCFVANGKLVLRRDGSTTPIVPTAAIKLLGRHNLENACAAVAAAAEAGVGPAAMETVLRSFSGLPHRLELVGELSGVRYVNDSFATTPESTIAAVEAFTEPLVLILGGSGKNSDFTKLADVLSGRNIRAVIGIGTEWPRLKSILRLPPTTKLIEQLSTMPEIFDAAKSVAEPGDVVLLSPACASFGMFADYKDRGDQFRHAVQSQKNIGT